MRLEEISLNFQQQLRVCSNTKKYHGQFTLEDEELALNAMAKSHIAYKTFEL